MFPLIRNSAQWKQVKDRVRLIRVASDLFGEPEEKTGKLCYWYCPFHGDGNDLSLQIGEGKVRWKCVTCGLWGDAIDLVRAAKNITFSQALAFLSNPEFYTEDVYSESLVTDEPLNRSVSNTPDNQWVEELFGDI